MRESETAKIAYIIMKGIMMFDNTNDLVYGKMDEELTTYLYELGMKDGLIEKSVENIGSDLHVSKDVIVQIFSPLIASYKVMHDQFGQKYQSIEMVNGTAIFFKRIENYVVVSVDSTNTRPGGTQKELSMFSTFVKILYGPSLYLITDDSIMMNVMNRREIISRMIEEWCTLKADCQMFLVEAVERLLLNPDIAALCVNLLQEVLIKARSHPTEGSFSHSFILVDQKLLALYSSRNSGQLPKRCVLLLIILAKTLQSANSNNDFGASKYKFGTTEKEPSVSTQSKNKNFPQTSFVFLPSQDDDIVPYMVYFLRISSRITLVLLCEVVQKTSLSKNLAFLVKNLDNLQNHPTSRFSMCAFEVFESAFQSVVSAIGKLKLPENTEQYIKILNIKWEQMKQFGLEEYLLNSENKILDLRLESGISAACEVCKVIFGEIVLQQSAKLEISSAQEAIFLEIKRMTLKRLKDCASYLEAKAEQNITMSSYVAEFPGLIHFIYIDRNSDCMIAPAVVLTEGHLKGRASLKKKIWNMVDFGRKYVNGARSYLCTWQHDDLRYFYSIWFENSHGRNVKPLKHIDLGSLQEKNMISENYFKELTEKCFPDASYGHIFCYELFCIHLVTVCSSDVIEQSQRLAAKLWDFSGAHRVSLELL